MLKIIQNNNAFTFIFEVFRGKVNFKGLSDLLTQEEPHALFLRQTMEGYEFKLALDPYRPIEERKIIYKNIQQMSNNEIIETQLSNHHSFLIYEGKMSDDNVKKLLDNKVETPIINDVEPLPMGNTHLYDVALSFADQERTYVKKVAEYLLDNEINVFYDEFEEINLWGQHLKDHFYEIYRNKSRYVIPFISQAYKKSEWTTHELKSALEGAINYREYILPVRFDNTEIDDLQKNPIGCIYIKNESPENLGKLIIKKIKPEHMDIKSSNQHSSRNLLIEGEKEILSIIEEAKKDFKQNEDNNKILNQITYYDYIVPKVHLKCPNLNSLEIKIKTLEVLTKYKEDAKYKRIVHYLTQSSIAKTGGAPIEFHYL